jgi:hypothetical protein
MLLTTTYIGQQYEGDSLLHFHGSSDYANVSQFYVILTLPILFAISIDKIDITIDQELRCPI